MIFFCISLLLQVHDGLMMNIGGCDFWVADVVHRVLVRIFVRVDADAHQVVVHVCLEKTTFKCFFLNPCIASPQAARLSIFFVGKSVLLYLLEEPELRMHYEEDREEERSPAPGRIRAHNISVLRCALFLCAITASQQHPVYWAAVVAQR